MKVAKPESDRDEIRALWNEIVELMGRRDTNRFLRHMWVSKYGDLKSTDLFSALKETIEGENTSSIEFVRLCNHECERYVELLDIHRDHLKSAAEYVDRLIKKLNIKSALPLLLSCYTRVSEEDFERIVRSILVFVVRYDVVSGLDVSGMESTFFTLAREVREMVKQKKSAQCARHIKEVLQKGSPTDEQVESFVADLQLNRDDAAYVLGRIAFRKGTNTKERGIHEANLEHIYPKNPKKDEWGGKENQEELNQYLNHIGNLTILGERINAGIANSEFSVKKPYYENSELKISNEVGWYNDWNVDTIKKRAQGLAKSVLEIWNFENTSWV